MRIRFGYLRSQLRVPPYLIVGGLIMAGAAALASGSAQAGGVSISFHFGSTAPYFYGPGFYGPRHGPRYGSRFRFGGRRTHYALGYGVPAPYFQPTYLQPTYIQPTYIQRTYLQPSQHRHRHSHYLPDGPRTPLAGSQPRIVPPSSILPHHNYVPSEEATLSLVSGSPAIGRSTAGCHLVYRLEAGVDGVLERVRERRCADDLAEIAAPVEEDRQELGSF